MSNYFCQLPDGRQVRIADEAADRLCCGVVVLDPVAVRENPAVWAVTASLGRQLAAQYAGHLPSEIPGLAEARTLYKSFGMDPSRHRPSSEALLRRALKGQDLYHINNLVDTCNLASLQFLLPIGMYDLPLIQGGVTLRTGRQGEEYPGIRKGPVHLAGRLGLFDEVGPFGSPTSDSARTCTSENTNSLLAVIMATGNYSSQAMAKNVAVFSQLFSEFCGADEALQAVLGGSA
jgi:DNA/RNA-binding domain of Phe-tRNA-synthetase-like protein